MIGKIPEQNLNLEKILETKGKLTAKKLATHF
jgi:hypothetical protein